MKRKRIRNRVKTLVAFSVYTDHATKDDDWVDLQRQTRAIEKQSGGAKMAFPSTLHRMLEEVEATGQSFIVGWLPHGRAFKVHDPKAFFERVLPSYFKLQSSYTAFQRQLNNYGFLRLVGPHQDQNAYYHECFLRGRVSLCTLMTRSASATGVVRCTFDPKTEPDFYAMPPLPCKSPIATNPSENRNNLSYGRPSTPDCLGTNVMTGGSAIETVGRAYQEKSMSTSRAKVPPSQQRRTKKVTYPHSMPWLTTSLVSTPREIDRDGEVDERHTTELLGATTSPARNVPSTQSPTLDVPVRARQCLSQVRPVANDSKYYNMQANSLILALSGRIPNEQSNVAVATSLESVAPPFAASLPQFDSLRGSKISSSKRSLSPVDDDDDTTPLALSNTLFAAIPNSYSIPRTPCTAQQKSEDIALKSAPVALHEVPTYRRDRQVDSTRSFQQWHHPSQQRLDHTESTGTNTSNYHRGAFNGLVGRPMTQPILSLYEGVQFAMSHQELNQRAVSESRTQLAEPSRQMLPNIDAATQHLFLSSNVDNPILPSSESIHGTLPLLTPNTSQRNDRQGSTQSNYADHFRSNHDSFDFNTSIPQASIRVVEASRCALPHHSVCLKPVLSNTKTPQDSVKGSSAMPLCPPLGLVLQSHKSEPNAPLNEQYTIDTKYVSLPQYQQQSTQPRTPPVDLFDDPSILFHNDNDDDSLSQSCGSTFSKTHTAL